MDIYKIQIPITTNADVPEALAYKSDRKGIFIPITKDLQKVMNGRLKAFFHCEVVDGKLMIGEEAGWQEW